MFVYFYKSGWIVDLTLCVKFCMKLQNAVGVLVPWSERLIYLLCLLSLDLLPAVLAQEVMQLPPSARLFPYVVFRTG